MTNQPRRYFASHLIVHHDERDGNGRFSFARASVTEKRQSILTCFSLLFPCGDFMTHELLYPGDEINTLRRL